MAEYHVGCGMFGIYAGILNKDNNRWKNKTEVTDEALCAFAQYLLENNKEFRFHYQDKFYGMRIDELEETGDEQHVRRQKRRLPFFSWISC